ncbi:conserved hypothetical protein [Trichinella spiralis]|uniref:hypothetical protein n=1 Tax=Trichinella spiralis TaxID=6334 RepID=UPI0001EFB5B3|nr:conserved hypothetical protein [Trichinella spiralis]
MSSIISKTVNGFREVLSFADLELEYNGGVENDEQTLPYGIAPLSERLFHLLNAVILGPGKDRLVMNKLGVTKLGAFAAYTTSQLNIFGHDGDTLGVNSAQLLLVKPKLPTIGIASQFCNLGQLHEPNVGRAAYGSTVQCFFGSVEFPEEPQSLDDSDAVFSHHQHLVRIFELP